MVAIKIITAIAGHGSPTQPYTVAVLVASYS